MWTLGLCAVLVALITDDVVVCDCVGPECNREDGAQGVVTADPQMLQDLTANFASILESLTTLKRPEPYANCMVSPKEPEQQPKKLEPQPFSNSIPLYARDCNDVTAMGHKISGIYMITPQVYPVSMMDTNVKSIAVYCDMVTDGGNWTVFQRRKDALVGFFRGWEEYKNGFGYLDGDHWLGLERLHQMTVKYKYELRVDLEDFSGTQIYAKYDNFRIGDESTFYMLQLGNFNGTAKDSLTYHANAPFSTNDQDHDERPKSSCAKSYKGAWWYKNCHYSNLNGLYRRPEEVSDVGVTWYAWKQRHISLKRSEMKIRRID